MAGCAGNRLAFAAPADETAITPDVTTVLKYASSPALAERLLRYCLSEEGQVLWGTRGEPDDPLDEATGLPVPGEPLYRYPILPVVYGRYADRLCVPDNPFERKAGFQVDMELEQRQARIIAPLLLAACGENHVLLQKTWQAVIEAGMPGEALADLTRPLFEEPEAYELGARFEQGGEEAEHLAAQWRGEYRAKYEKVLADLGG